MQPEDPTYVDVEYDDPFDPRVSRFHGVARHGMTPFDVPWISHIKGNLWQGGCTTGLVLPDIFEHVISLYQWESYTIPSGQEVEVTVVEMYDSSDEPDYDNVLDLAQTTFAAMQDGPTLVHCQAGLNRSSLIAGAALVLDGMKPGDAIDLLRERRSPACLCNKTFENFLRGFSVPA